MKEKTVTYKSSKISEPMVLRDSAAMGLESALGRVVSVRDAKAHLSALLEWVAGGHELTITSDGLPKARLVSVEEAKPRKIFQGMGEYLSKQRIHRGLSADEAVNQDRDARGW